MQCIVCIRNRRRDLHVQLVSARFHGRVYCVRRAWVACHDACKWFTMPFDQARTTSLVKRQCSGRFDGNGCHDSQHRGAGQRTAIESGSSEYHTSTRCLRDERCRCIVMRGMVLAYELFQRFVDAVGLDAVQSFQAAGAGGHASEIGASNRLYLVKFVVKPFRHSYIGMSLRA